MDKLFEMLPAFAQEAVVRRILVSGLTALFLAGMTRAASKGWLPGVTPDQLSEFVAVTVALVAAVATSAIREALRKPKTTDAPKP